MQNVVTPEVAGQRIGMVQVYRAVRAPNQPVEVVSLVDVASPSMPQGWARGSADRLAARAASGDEAAPSIEEPMAAGGVLMHVAHRGAQSRRPDHRRRRGERLPVGDLAERARRMSKAYEDYTQLRVLEAAAGRRLRVVLRDGDAADSGRLDVDGAVSREAHHAAGADAVGGGAAKLAPAITTTASSTRAATNSARWSRPSMRWRPKWRRAAAGSSAPASISRRKHDEGEGRRRYIEAILERIATGVVSIDRAGRIGTINPSALRLLELTDEVIGSAAVDVFARPDLAPVNDVLDQAARAKMDSFAQEVALVRDGRERHVVAAATRVAGTDGSFDGTVLVVDDVTPLIRAQKVAAWREVARRLAHEIKNPLTPIQLSAERLRRKLSDIVAAAAGTGAGMHVDDHRRGRIAEGPGRRVLAVCAHAGAARGADRAARVPERHAGALRRAVRRRSSSSGTTTRRVTQVRLDPEQMKRVMINLIDNAIEAMGRQGTIVIETARDVSNSLVRIVVADTGPGIPAGRARQAVPAVLLDQGPRQRPRPGDRAAHRRRARRQHRRHR